MTASVPTLRGLAIVSVALIIVTAGFVPAATGQSAQDERAIEVDLSAPSDPVSQGSTVSVTATLRNTGDRPSPAPVFDLAALPDGWTVDSWSNADATYRDATNEWLWTELRSGEREQLTLTLDVPERAESVSVSGELTDGLDNTDTDSVRIAVRADQPTADGGDDEDGAPSSQTDVASRVEVVTPRGVITTALELPSNITPGYAERRAVAADQTPPVTVTFGPNASVSTVRFANDSEVRGNVTVTRLLEARSITDDVPGRVVDTFYLTGSSSAEAATATVRLSRSRSDLMAAGVDATNLRVAHRTNGTWRLLDTTVEEQTSERVTLSFTTDGFSAFAVTAVEPPNATITGVPETVQAGESVPLDAGNSTAPDGALDSYEWTVDGRRYTGETVTVRLDDPGQYTAELTVTNDAGRSATTQTTIVVEARTQPTTTTPAPSPTDTVTATRMTPTRTLRGTETTESSAPGFGVAVALGALLVVALVGIRRQW